jgi:hypothetical protein
MMYIISSLRWGLVMAGLLSFYSEDGDIGWTFVVIKPFRECVEVYSKSKRVVSLNNSYLVVIMEISIWHPIVYYLFHLTQSLNCLVIA